MSNRPQAPHVPSSCRCIRPRSWPSTARSASRRVPTRASAAGRPHRSCPRMNTPRRRETAARPSDRDRWRAASSSLLRSGSLPTNRSQSRTPRTSRPPKLSYEGRQLGNAAVRKSAYRHRRGCSYHAPRTRTTFRRERLPDVVPEFDLEIVDARGKPLGPDRRVNQAGSEAVPRLRLELRVAAREHWEPSRRPARTRHPARRWPHSSPLLGRRIISARIEVQVRHRNRSRSYRAQRGWGRERPRRSWHAASVPRPAASADPPARTCAVE